MAELKAAAKFGTCCEELKDAISGDEFEPLIMVGEDEVLYLSVGIVAGEDEEEESAMVEHPLFFCPFCGAKVQTPDEVKAKSDSHDHDHEGA